MEEEDISKEIRESAPKPTPIVTKEIAEKEEKIAERMGEIPITKDYLEERTKKIISFFKKKQVWVIGILIIALILGVYIRTLPMQDHGGQPGLWDITTNTWTLGPDLDPFFFLRYAKMIIEQGSLPEVDIFRNVPIGFNTSEETKILPYMIAFTYKILNFLGGDVNIEYAGVIFPVIMFALTILSFFLFVREIFIRNNGPKIKANTIALISTFFMIVFPVFLARTVAGIPEKESAAFFFMFLAFYFYLKAWKLEKLRDKIIFSFLAGLSTAIMGLIWGGVIYVFATIGIANFVAFLIGKIDKKGFFLYGGWLISSLFFLLAFSNKYSILGFLKSTQYLVAFLTFFVLLVHFTIWNTKLSRKQIFSKYKLPKNIISLITSIIAGPILVSILFGPGFIFEKIRNLIDIFINPTTGRWGITVAENRQPYFKEWASNFGPFVKNIPLMFWMFFAGSLVLFKKMLTSLGKKEKWVLTGLYFVFFMGVVFSRYAPGSLLNGENFISKLFYFGSVLLLMVYSIKYYLEYEKRGDKSFSLINFEFLFLFSLFVLVLVTVRSAVRLIMVLGPIAAILVAYLIYESIIKFKKTKEENRKIFWGIIVLLILLASLFSFFTYYKEVKAQAYNFVPSYYTQQWQKAMEWVRDETPKESVFAHWWDYGYWVQTMGERATVLDGGNTIVYWNYLMGRLVLTGDNQKDSLEFLHNHDTTHLLIDSTDIGKYTAFSGIGSNEEYDRYSWVGTFLLDASQTQETQNKTKYFYPGGIALDEDLVVEENGKEIFLPAHQTGIGGMIIPIEKGEGGKAEFSNPSIITIYRGQQQEIKLRYLFIGGEFFDFGEGIEAAAYVFPRIDTQGQQASSNSLGAVMYLSPRLFRGMLAQIYLLKDPLGKYPNYKLVHTEPNLFIDNMNQQGMNLPDFVYYQGLQGPIKIWEIEYTGNEEIKEEYLDKDYTKYISWRL